VSRTARKIPGWTMAAAASVAVHAVLVGGFGWLAYHSLHEREALARAAETQWPEVLVPIELPALAEGTLFAPREPDPRGVVPELNGGSAIPRVDTGAPGAGGDATVEKAAINFSDGDERMRLSPDLISRLDRDQLHRIDAARVRQSWEDRRSTTHPMELTFLASGVGTLEERRKIAALNPSRGALQAPLAGARGADLGTPPRDDGDAPRAKLGGDRLGSMARASGVGLLHAAAGSDHRTSAAVASARPDVTEAPVAVNANDKGRTKDDVDTEQEVATTVRSLVHASTAGGRVTDRGRGGSGGGGDPGAGGTSGSGSTTRALGIGEGATFDIDTGDPRLQPWFRQIKAKIHPLWANAFPKSALLDLKQGTVILTFTVFADGSIGPVGTHRPSGIPEFDRNCADAVRRANPLPAIPSSLGISRINIMMPFRINNPVIK
jgi:TonB family protein